MYMLGFLYNYIMSKMKTILHKEFFIQLLKIISFSLSFHYFFFQI